MLCGACPSPPPPHADLFHAGRTPIPAIMLGLKELKAKAVPDMLSALSTVAYEDVTHLLGGVDLLSPPCRHRRGGSPCWFWCKAILAGAVLTVDGGVQGASTSAGSNSSMVSGRPAMATLLALFFFLKTSPMRFLEIQGWRFTNRSGNQQRSEHQVSKQTRDVTNGCCMKTLQG